MTKCREAKVLQVYPQRKNQQLAENTFYSNERSSRSRGGPLFTKDFYTGNVVSYTSKTVKPKKVPKKASNKIDKVKKSSVSKQKKEKKKERKNPIITKRRQESVMVIKKGPKSTKKEKKDVGKTRLASSQVKKTRSASQMKRKNDSKPSASKPKKIKTKSDLSVVEKDHKKTSKKKVDSKNPSTSAAIIDTATSIDFKNHDSDIIENLIEIIGEEELEEMLEEPDVFKQFFVEELIPAMRNYVDFKTNENTKIVDASAGKYEVTYENGIKIETPLPPNPIIFPMEIEENERIRKLENEKRRIAQEGFRMMHYSMFQGPYHMPSLSMFHQ